MQELKTGYLELGISDAVPPKVNVCSVPVYEVLAFQSDPCVSNCVGITPINELQNAEISGI
jgi:hypothetical protein